MVKFTPPSLSNKTLQQRLLTGASIKGGARGSLTRCAAKLGSLNAKLASTGGSSTDQEILAIKDELKREVRLFQIEMHKTMIMIQSAEKELQDVTAAEQQMAASVEQKQQAVQELRNQAASVAKTRKCWKEYEALAKLARQRSPRRILQAKMDKANADLETTKKKLYETAAESKVREKQFHLLIQVMTDLRRSLGEAIEIPPPPKKKDDDDDEEEDKKKKPAAQQTGKEVDKGGVVQMETEDDDDEGDLYDGL